MLPTGVSCTETQFGTVIAGIDGFLAVSVVLNVCRYGKPLPHEQLDL